MTMTDNDPFELRVDNRDHIEWIKNKDDPTIWHEATIAIMTQMGDPYDFLPWLITHPKMDRGTAGWLLLWCAGAEYLAGKESEFYARIPDHQLLKLLDQLCTRSEKIGFSSDEVGLDTSFEKARQNCQTIITEGKVHPSRTIPHSILSTPFKPKNDHSAYFVSDGILLNTDFMMQLIRH